MTRARALRALVGLPPVLVASLALSLGLLASPASAANLAPSPAPGATAPSPRPAPPEAPIPTAAFHVTVTPDAGTVVGVAYPITAKFSAPVIDRAAAEHHMHVYVNKLFSKGAWYWRNSTTAMFRLAGFWPGHATIEVRLTLAGVEVAHSPTLSYVGDASTTRTHVIRTDRSLVAMVDGIKDRFTVVVDGKVVAVFKTSLGKKDFETRSGIKAVMEKYALRHMTSVAAGITDPKDQYDLQVPWAVRITPSGEFVHGAPWATARLGRYNGSHGCTNLTTSDSQWFFDHVIPGDAVVTTGTPRTMEFWNGLGAPYNMPWAQWLAKSSTKGKP